MPAPKPAAQPRRRGAPLGNLNALKTGRRSKQLKTLIFVLMEVPQLRDTMLQLIRAQRRRGSLDDLRDAVHHYHRLLQLRSRQRTIRSILRQSKLWRAQVPNKCILPSLSLGERDQG